MKKWLRFHWKAAICFVLVFVVIIPILINVLFKINSSIEFFRAEWSAGDALVYYGAILASIIAVYGVFLTIQYNQNNYREDVRNRTLPYIALEFLQTKFRRNLFRENLTEDDDEPEGYFEYKLQNYYCILENGIIEYKTDLTKTQKRLINNGGLKSISRDGVETMVAIDEINVPIEIENVGNGTAVQFRFGINRVEVSENKKKLIPALSLKVGQVIHLHIFSSDCGKESKNTGEYTLSFYYEDIYSNRYKQEFQVHIDYIEEKHATSFSVDMEHKQEFLGGRNNG